MKKLALIVLISLSSISCAIHYHNAKAIKGKGNDIKTPYGTVEGAKADFKSTLDVWIPWKFNEVN